MCVKKNDSKTDKKDSKDKLAMFVESIKISSSTGETVNLSFKQVDGALCVNALNDASTQQTTEDREADKTKGRPITQQEKCHYKGKTSCKLPQGFHPITKKSAGLMVSKREEKKWYQ